MAEQRTRKHHHSCQLESGPWDIEGVRCSCPTGWPRKNQRPDPSPDVVAQAQELLAVVRKAIRPLDSGALHCRYCHAGSNDKWQHESYCIYDQSVRDVDSAHEALAALLQHLQSVEQARAEAERKLRDQQVRVFELEMDRAVPGRTVCDVCKFQLTTTILNVANGTAGAPIAPSVEPCPNGCGPLRALTWKESDQQATENIMRLFDRAEAAEKAYEEAMESANVGTNRANHLRDAVCAILSSTGKYPHDIPRLAKEALDRDNQLLDAEERGSVPHD